MAQRQQEIAHTARERSQRIVAARLLGFAVADEVGRDDREALGERGHDESPGRRAAGHAVDEDDHRPGSAGAVADAVAVDLDVPELEARRAQVAIVRLPRGNLSVCVDVG